MITVFHKILKEPFFVALSNTLEHEEVVELKDRLVDVLHSQEGTMRHDPPPNGKRSSSTPWSLGTSGECWT